MIAFIRSFLIPVWLLVASALWLSTAHAAERTLLVLGDSLSAAYGIAPEQGWVTLLDARLAQRDPDYEVVNASISGETTGGGLARLPAALERHEPEVVIIELGGNDGLRGYPIGRIRANLAQMVELALDAGARVVLTGMQLPPNYGPRYTEAFHRTFAEIAGDPGERPQDAERLVLLPFLLEGIATDPALMQDDGIHPTAAAQPLILDNVWPVVEPLLEASRDPAH